MATYQSQKAKENLQKRLTKSQKAGRRTPGPRSQEIQGDKKTKQESYFFFAAAKPRKRPGSVTLGTWKVLVTLTEGDMIGTKCEDMIDGEGRQPFKGCDEREERWGGNWRETWYTVSGFTVFMS